MPPEPTISIRYAERILHAAESLGLDRVGLEQRAGMRRLTLAGDTRIPGQDYLRLWSLAMEEAVDPAFPLRVAAVTGIETYGVFGFATMTSGTLGEGLERACRYLRIWTDLAKWRLDVTPGEARLCLIPSVEGQSEARPAAECALAEMLLGSREYLGMDWTPATVHFRWRRPRSVEHLETFFGAPLAFERPYTALELDASLLALPMRKADPAMAEFFARHAEEMLNRLPASATLSGQIRRLIEQQLRNGLPSAQSIAAALALSTRTLRRKLAEEGTTLADLIQEMRCALAKQYLSEGKLSLGEIAFFLGFSDVSSFHRSFRRCTGLTPAAYRRDRSVHGA